MQIDEEEEFSDWCCSCNFEGERYGLTILASSREDAQRRLNHIGFGQVYGELKGALSS